MRSLPQTASGEHSFFRGRRIGEIGEIAFGDAAELGANHIGGKARAQQAAIQGSDFALIERAAKVREAAFQACADQTGFVRLGEDGFESGVNIAVRNAAGAKFAGDAEASLAAQFSMLVGIIQSVARVVEIVKFAESGDDWGN